MKHFINGTYLLYHEISIQVAHNFVKMQCNRASTISDFKASKDGQWKNIHNVKIMKIYGESDSWKERLPDLVQGYLKENIWNLYKTDCVWRALPYHHSFFISAKEVRM